jgi:hypothetical protein
MEFFFSLPEGSFPCKKERKKSFYENLPGASNTYINEKSNFTGESHHHETVKKTNQDIANK